MAQTQKRRQYQSKAAVAKQNFMDYIKMAAIMAVIVIAVVYFIRIKEGGTAAFTSTDTFLEGIYVNGVELKGMTQDEGLSAVNEQIHNRLTSPITLTLDDKSWTITPKELDAEMLDVVSNVQLAWNIGHVGSQSERRSQAKSLKEGDQVNYDCKLTYDESKLDDFIEMVKVNVDILPVDAEISFDISQKPKVTDHINGRTLDAAQLKQRIKDVIEQGESANIPLQLAVTEPQYTTAILGQCTELISTWTTDARSSNYNRTKNIIRALKAFRAFRVDPGQHVSFNKEVGFRTVENGFFEADEFQDNSVVKGIGGGTCQASTTLFNALIRAGMTIEERHQHSMLVSYCKPSQDATVTDRGKDLTFTNYTDYPMFIFASCNGIDATVSVYGMKPEYRIKYVTKDVKVDIKWSSASIRTSPDTKRKYCKAPGDKVLKSEGKYGRKTEGWIQYYDWNTGELVEEERRFADNYEPMPPTYWVYAE